MSGRPSRTARTVSVAAAVLAVFALWLAVSSAASGIAFFYSIPDLALAAAVRGVFLPGPTARFAMISASSY